MLIGAWIAPPHKIKGIEKNFNTQKQYKLLKESGINTIYALYENAKYHKEEVLKAIKYAKGENINYFVRDSRIIDVKKNEELKMYIDDYIELADGILVSDEPGINDFNKLKKAYQIFKEYRHDKFFYINLMPIHATKNQFFWGAWKGNLEVEKEYTYEDYYNSFIKEINLPYFSYDFYPFEGEFPNIRSDYFKQLDVVYSLSRKYDLITLCFIQCTKFNDKSRVPQKEEVLWQVNTSLAYGTKGIQYFTYFLPENNEFEQFMGSLVSNKGKKTSLFDVVKNINKWLNKISGIIINSRVDSIKSDDKKIVTIFDDGNNYYKMITNLSLEKTLEVEISNESDVIATRKPQNNSYILRPGEAIFIKKQTSS